MLTSNPTASSVDRTVFEEAVLRIRDHALAIEALAQKDVSPKEFFTTFLDRIVSALAADAGAVWLVARDGALQPTFVTGDAIPAQYAAGRPEGFPELLKGVLSSGQGRVVVTSEPATADSPTAADGASYLLAPLLSVQRPEGIVEIVQKRNASVQARRGHVQFLMQMCDLAGRFLANQTVRDLERESALLAQADVFTRAVNSSLSVTEIAFSAANEARRIFACDRVTLAVRRDDGWRIESISGQDSFDLRSNVVRILGRLAVNVGQSSKAFVFRGDAAELTPEIRAILGAYPATAQLKFLAAAPLSVPGQRVAEDPSAAGALGTIILEQFSAKPLAPLLERRIEIVRLHTALSLSRALEHEGLFLLPVVRMLGRLRPILKLRRLPRKARRGAYVLVALLLLAVIPADFSVEGRGTLEPSVRRGVFADLDGVIDNVRIHHGETVAAGQELARMHNVDLNVALEGLRGDLGSTREQLRTLETSILRGAARNDLEREQWASEREQLHEKARGLETQIALKEQQQARLTIKSPIAGRVVTWDVRETLSDRPIARGQRMMTVADLSGPWELQIRVHESVVGHLARARSGGRNEQPVRFSLATDPATRYAGTVSEVADRADNDPAEGSSVLVRASIDKDELAQLHPGATVVARIACGRRALGYVWFHDVIEFVQSRILFRF